MPLIDLSALARFLGNVKQMIDERLNQPTPVYDAISEDGVAYTATVPGVTELYAGLKITVKLSRNSASTAPSLNVNNLGVKGIRQPLTMNNVATTTGTLPTWLNASVPITLTYSGTLWKVDFARPSASGLYGTAPITSGGTGANNAEAALANLGGASLDYVNEQLELLSQRIAALEQ